MKTNPPANRRVVDMPRVGIRPAIDGRLHGIREPFLVATENDSLNGLCRLLGHRLTGSARIFADVRTYRSPGAVKRVTGKQPGGLAANGLPHLINSGAAALDGGGKRMRNGRPALKPFQEISPLEGNACLNATIWPPAVCEYFRGGGLSSAYGTRANMAATIFRTKLIKGLEPALQNAKGRFVDLPEEIYLVLEARTNPTRPSQWFVPNVKGPGVFSDVYSVRNAWGANHGTIRYGQIGADSVKLAAMLRIPVYMHHINGEDNFRPGVRTAFGTADLEGADFRACASFGPLHGKNRR